MNSSLIRKAYLASIPLFQIAETRYNRRLARKASMNPYEPQKGLKVAFVKQEVLPGLFCCAKGSSVEELVFSSLKQTGPVALFTKFGADAWIVKEELDPECQVWQEVVRDCGHGSLDDFYKLKTEPYLNGKRGHTIPQGNFAVSVDSIDWGQYDIVICVNPAVPARITRKYPKTVWCYLIDHPTMSSYFRSQNAPIEGYDLFFNNRFRSVPFIPRRPRWHEIDWPYDFQYYGCFHEMLGKPLDASEQRKGIFIENHTQELLTPAQLKRLEAIAPLYFITPDTKSIVLNLLKCKYYFRMGGRKLWGNGMIEAVVTGSLAFGSPVEYVNRSLFTPETSASSADQLIDTIEAFEKDDDLYRKQVQIQRALVDYLCFQRPLEQVLEKRKSILERRGTAN